MILQDDTVDLLKRLNHAARRCIMCEQYFNATTGLENQYLKFSQNCFAELCILHWSTIFGSHTAESTHFKSIFDRSDVGEVSNGEITVDSVRADFLVAIDMDKIAYTSFWDNAHNMRNKLVAHRDDLDGVYIPDFKLCKKQCGSVIKSTAKLLNFSIQNGDTRNDVDLLYRYVIEHGSERGIEFECKKAIRDSSFL